VTQSLIVDLEGLFLAVRLHARKTRDPDYKRVKAPEGYTGGSNCTHRVHRKFWLRLPRYDELIEVPRGTEIVLFQEVDPNPPPGFITRRDMTQSIGTLKLPHLHATLRGNGRVSFTNPRKGRLRMGYAAVGARSARDE
jgi:hypothetical protein